MIGFDRYHVAAQTKPFGRSIALYIWQQLPDRNIVSAATNMTFEQIELGTFAPPVLEISETTAQALVDALWQCGIRPTDGTGSAGALQATQNHLKDMRDLVFKLLGEAKNVSR